MDKQLLIVPGKWLQACGMGSVDRAFPVLSVVTGFFRGTRATFATVDRDGFPWVVHVEVRGATFV